MEDIVLRIRSARTRQERARAATDLDTSDAETLLVLLYESGHPYHGQAVLEVLALAQRPNVDALLVQAGASNPKTAGTAQHVLAELGETQMLIEMASYSFLSCDAICAFGQAAIPALIDILRTGPDALKPAAAYALGQSRHPEALHTLCSLLSASNGAVRRNAIIGLGYLGDPKAYEALGAASQQSTSAVERVLVNAAIDAIDGKIGYHEYCDRISLKDEEQAAEFLTRIGRRCHYCKSPITSNSDACNVCKKPISNEMTICPKCGRIAQFRCESCSTFYNTRASRLQELRGKLIECKHHEERKPEYAWNPDPRIVAVLAGIAMMFIAGLVAIPTVKFMFGQILRPGDFAINVFAVIGAVLYGPSVGIGSGIVAYEGLNRPQRVISDICGIIFSTFASIHVTIVLYWVGLVTLFKQIPGWSELGGLLAYVTILPAMGIFLIIGTLAGCSYIRAHRS